MSAAMHDWLARPDDRAAVAAELPACVPHESWTDRAAVVVRDLEQLMSSRRRRPALERIA